jgi:hypothetical protein
MSAGEKMALENLAGGRTRKRSLPRGLGGCDRRGGGFGTQAREWL